MVIELYCKSCGKKLRVPESAAGKMGQCNTCKATMTIPMQSEEIVPMSDATDEPVAISPKQAAQELDSRKTGIPRSPAAAVGRETYYTKPFVILALFVLTPLGIYLLWKSKDFSKQTKSIVSVIGGVLFLIAMISPTGKQPTTNPVPVIAAPISHPQPSAAPPTPTAPTSPEPSPLRTQHEQPPVATPVPILQKLPPVVLPPPLPKKSEPKIEVSELAATAFEFSEWEVHPLSLRGVLKWNGTPRGRLIYTLYDKKSVKLDSGEIVEQKLEKGESCRIEISHYPWSEVDRVLIDADD